MLDLVSQLPDLTTVVPYTGVFYNVYLRGHRGHLTEWHRSRLMAEAARAYGRPSDVAAALQKALDGMGGAKPGASVEEIAERILLLTQTAEALSDDGRIDEATELMQGGLM